MLYASVVPKVQIKQTPVKNHMSYWLLLAAVHEQHMCVDTHACCMHALCGLSMGTVA